MSKKVVFILGIGRSGSTMVDLMLGTHSQGFSLGEISKLPEIYARYSTAAEFCPGSTFWQDRLSEEDIRCLVAGFSGQRIHRRIPLKLEKWVRELLRQDTIFNPYSLLCDRLEKPLLIDSSKYPYWVSGRLTGREFRDGSVQPYLLHVVRDGRAILNSYLRARPHWSVEKIATEWLTNLEKSQQIYDSFPAERKMQVRYESLATQPEQTMQEVCRCLDIPFEPSMLDYWKGDHHYIGGSLSTRALIARYKNQPVAANVQKVHGSYYETMDLTIKLDQRWRQELDSEKLARFYELVGDRNQPFEWAEANLSQALPELSLNDNLRGVATEKISTLAATK
jgi:hypothetical protein